MFLEILYANFFFIKITLLFVDAWIIFFYFGLIKVARYQAILFNISATASRHDHDGPF